MVNIYVDTREPERVRSLARTLGFIPMALECGDFSTDKLIVERKGINDFINSTFARYGETPRIFDQCERIFAECQRTERIPMLLITGRLSNSVCPQCGHTFHGAEQTFTDRKQTLNKASVFGSFASIWVRYAINIIWTEQPTAEWLVEIKSIAEKIDEGKYLMPQRKQLKEFARDRNVAVIERALEVTHGKAEVLAKRFGGLYGVLDAAKNKPSEIFLLENFGARTLKKIQELGGIG